MHASEQHVQTGQNSPYSQLVNLIGYRWKWSALVEVVRLDIASILENGAMTTEELAIRTDTHPVSLYKLLQFLSYSNVFAEVSPGRFAQTPLSAFLRPDVPGSVYRLLCMQGSCWHTQTWNELGYSLRTGEPAFAHTHGKGIWQYLNEYPDEKQTFDMVMDDVSRVFIQPIVEAYDFQSVRSVVDVGGGRGTLLMALVQQYPHLCAMLFDMSATVEEALPLITKQEANRITTQSGDFFESVPSGADMYLLKQILHDWDDAHAVTILRTCRKAMHAQSKLIIIEMFPQPVDTKPTGEGYPPFIGFLQLQMMVLFGGCERSEEEFEVLLEQAGLQHTRTIATRSPYRLLECQPVHS